MLRGKSAVAWASVGSSSSFPDIGAYEFQTSAYRTTVDTTSSDLFNNDTQTANTLEWSLASPIPFHAFNMLPIQS